MAWSSQRLLQIGAEDGNYYAYFRGHPTDNSQDCLGTTVHLKSGALYNIGYYLGTDGSTLGTGAAMWVVIGTSFGIDLSQDIMLTAFFPNAANALPYQEFSTNYLATTTAPIILSFHGIIRHQRNWQRPISILLDDVWVKFDLSAAEPEPLGFQPTHVFTWPYTNIRALAAS